MEQISFLLSNITAGIYFFVLFPTSSALLLGWELKVKYISLYYFQHLQPIDL